MPTRGTRGYVGYGIGLGPTRAALSLWASLDQIAISRYCCAQPSHGLTGPRPLSFPIRLVSTRRRRRRRCNERPRGGTACGRWPTGRRGLGMSCGCISFLSSGINWLTVTPSRIDLSWSVDSGNEQRFYMKHII
jgi:hypothetical protein